MKRGRKPTPAPAGFRELAQEITNPTALAMRLGRHRRLVLRWLADIGMPHEIRQQRPRNVPPKWLALATIRGRRIRTRLYEVWASMRKRCLVPSCPDFPRYGGRGVTICDSWLREYGAFRSWAVTDGGYRKGLTLDRKDSDGNYEPDNCRFVTKADQQLNIRRGIKLTVDGETRSLAEWARVSGLDPDLIRSRVYNGWPHKRAVFETSSR